MTKEGFVVWFTGLPGAGKTTTARAVRTEFARRGVGPVEMLDGDELRESPLGRGLGFSKADRDEHVARVGFVAELLARNGVIVLVALVSPYAAAREALRARIARLRLVHVDCALPELERRDPKGQYAKARRGEIAGFTGISDPYEPPTHPDLVLRTDRTGVRDAVDAVISMLDRHGDLTMATRP